MNAAPHTAWLRVRGIVQGVGFRPHVWRLARELNLAGWVRNDAEGVAIALFGDPARIAQFRQRLVAEAPPLSRIDAVTDAAMTGPPPTDGRPFAILDSTGGPVSTAIGADAAVCADCLAEIFDPAHRRHRYAFTTCTHCGPRYTIAHRLPYDRATTSLVSFPLCEQCAAEYADPADRRFHAEATCCPVCGPRLALRNMGGAGIDGDPIVETLRLLCAGQIVAIKGLGGFHLACDARNAGAVARLRERKMREAKPFAVMAARLSDLGSLVQVSDDDRRTLVSPAAPVVLLDKRPACDAALPGVAPGVGALGVMRPNTPLQWLLYHEAAGRPVGLGWTEDASALPAEPPLLLVMTSANPQGEPLVIDDAEAMDRLQGIADAVLGHDRAIVARADDSVRRGPLFIRRGRGYTPQAIRLPHAGPSVLAFGGWFKNTVCVTRGEEAFVSTHIGDLDNAAACAFLDETVGRMLDLTGIAPDIVAHDAHPDFYSTQAALRFAAEHQVPAIAVQHHHAHIAAVAAEQHLNGPLLGLALDGVGLGEDGGLWGGELLRVEGARCTRQGHLSPLLLPGGDKAAREPWRMGAAALWALGRGDEIETRYAAQAGARTVHQMLQRGLNCPPTSSAGRLFDAAAGLLGLCSVARYEAEAAMQLEALADRHVAQFGAPAPLQNGWSIRSGVLELSPLLAALADAKEAGVGAALFHATLAAALADWVIATLPQAALAPENCKLLAGAGGCWLNRRLADALRAHLAAAGVDLREPQQVPPGDGGLALGQAWVAIQSTIQSASAEQKIKA